MKTRPLPLPPASAQATRLSSAVTAAVLAAATVAVLAGCAQVTAVATGETVVADRLVVQVPTPWNQFASGLGDNRPTWTLEGVAVDALRFYVGIKDGELIAPTPGSPSGVRPLAFKSTMGTTEIVDLFQALWTRDGSVFTLDRVGPAEFAGGPGFRFEYTLVRKQDEVRLGGVAWGTVRDGQLHLVVYTAPRLGFFARGLPGAEAVVKSVRLRG